MPINEHETGKCSGWTAIHNFMPPAPAKLRVHTKCTFPKPGFRVTLKKHVPQGIVPQTLLLDKEVKLPIDPQKGGETVIEATYEEETDFHYTEVLILPDQVKIKVEDVY